MNRIARWGGPISALLLLLLFLANVPFYSGSSIGSHFSWRMEHGRIALHASSSPVHESFYIALNSEGVHFTPEWRADSLTDWRINIPLWMPLLLTVVISAAAWRRWLRRRPRPSDRCPTCRYPRAGLAPTAPCPECGEPLSAAPSPHPAPVRSDSPPL
jgi:hypothetical protein